MESCLPAMARAALFGPQMAIGPVSLAPLSVRHELALRAAADDPAIWTWFPRRGAGADWPDLWAFLRREQKARRWAPYVVSIAGEAVGMTCYMAIEPAHDRVEIGGTWYARRAQGGLVNPSAKRLMLERAFDAGAARVEFKTDALNAASRAALTRLGAVEEGGFRSHMRRPDGSRRDTVYFSILRDEWPNLRAGLDARIAAFAPLDEGV